ncbi:right-handed parallel beta-helix repeat-containing protein [Pseudoduganella lutea]|uniref:right-handed parallel beta-helix repeat-containing protein n=1 Tax=Pseudoduganella lutea TaxID=321985 RepID=UPI0013EEC14E|nr:right-handed parallel beta-helix repeat-containing protein [Pseudoduganella lutea]
MPRFLQVLVAGLCLAAAAACAAPGATGTAAGYYLDSAAGSDDNPGTRERPWKSIERANRAVLKPGEGLYFARGRSWAGALRVAQSGTERQPIVVSSYGKGRAPRLSNPFHAWSMGRVIEVFGSHVVVENLYLHDTPTPPPDNPPVPWKESAQHRGVTQLAALFVDRGAQRVTVRNNEFVNTPVGVRVRGAHSRVVNNLFRDSGKITEQWGAIAVSIVGPHNEVAYNRMQNIGFYGGIYVNDGAAVELDGEDPEYDAHDIHVHHNVSFDVKGGFLEIAGRSQNVLIEHNLSVDVDKFVGGTNVRNVRILNNTIVRLSLPNFPESDFFPLGTVFWSFNDKGIDGFEVANNLFVLDGRQRLYKSAAHPLGIVPEKRANNLYTTPNGDVPTMLGGPLAPTEVAAPVQFVDEQAEDYRPRLPAPRAAAGYFGAFAPGQPAWKAGLVTAD